VGYSAIVSDALRGYHELAPPAALADVVETFWVWTGPGGENRVLPDGCTDLMFALEERASGVVPRLDAIGPMTRPLDASRRGVPLIVAARLLPGAAPVLGPPADRLLDARVPLEALWGRSARELADRLGGARGLAPRLGILARGLEARRADGPAPDRGVAGCVATIRHSGGRVPVERLAARLGVSDRQLRRRFAASVGVGPRELGRIVRLQGLLAAARRDLSAGWTQLALDAGYYDQSHMIGDFRRWAGESPARHLSRLGTSDSSRTPAPAPA